jgi:phage-related protein
VSPRDKPLVWLRVAIRTPPLSRDARIEAGYLLRQLQQGRLLSMPESRPMPSIEVRCHELRVNDHDVTWRVVYRIDDDAIVIADVFAKKSPRTPKSAIQLCRTRLKEYDRATGKAKAPRK